jgi:hypothetical protein
MLQAEVGRAGLNVLYPNDFEVYLMSLELVKINNEGKEEIINFFSFPVMPNNINQTEPQITNIKKTVGGITILNTNTYIPKDIVIQGNFGRYFKIVIGSDIINFKGLSLNPMDATKNVAQSIKKKVTDTINGTTNSFSETIKTGYGCIKILQAICDSSVEVDNGRPRRLYLHNPSFGESHLVKVTSFSTNQNMQSNMIWNYSLSLKSIAPANNVKDEEDKSLKNALIISNIQSGINKVAGSIVRMLAI